MAEKRLRSRQRAEIEEQMLLEQELCETKSRLQRAFDAFNLVSDPDLVEAWIYEINAQQARYSYLIKRRKALEGCAPAENGVRT